jgi:hypothetical protein
MVKTHRYLDEFYSLQRIRGRTCSTDGGEEECIFVIGSKTKRPRRRWDDDIEMDLGKRGWVGLTGLVWLRIGTHGELL